MVSPNVIRTPDQRLRVFVSSTLGELAPEREAVRGAIERLHLAPVMFELGARPHPPRELYRAYLAQSHVFVGVYWQRYGWVAPGESVSGLEDEYRLAGERPRLLYIKEPAPEREERLTRLLRDFQDDDRASYKRFSTPEELADLVQNDLALMLSERFEAAGATAAEPPQPATAPPLPLTETVGRAEAIAEVAERLRSGARLVTLTGAGGIGKTRLALEVAREVRDAYPDGVHFVPLAPVTEAARAVRTIADRLGVRVEGTQSVVDAIAAQLRDRRMLLVLDNLEQVVAVGADIVAVLAQAPGLQVLATSRQALRVRGEQEVPVPPLPLPDPGEGFERLDLEPAVRLFVERARAVAPSFRLTEENARAVAELCRRLDGLPLAIELAAARVRLLPPAALFSRIAGRLDLLVAGGADVPERQRTLRATIDWSHELLDEPERALFARLSVFAGGFTLPAAEAVCGVEGEPPVLDTLASLLDKSLLVSEDDPLGDEPRFRMLETVRAYAWERLAERGEVAEFRRRHLDWYRRQADIAQPHMCGPGQRDWALRFDPERPNIRAAVDAALDFGDDESVIAMAWDLYVYYETRDAADEPEGWMARVRAAGRPLDELLAARLNTTESWSRIARGDYEGRRPLLESALAVFRREGLALEAAVALLELANIDYMVERDHATAIERLEESFRLFESVDHDWGAAVVQIMIGALLAETGDSRAAEEHHRRSLVHSQRIDNEPLVGRANAQIGLARVLQDRPGEALPYLQEAAALFRRGRYQTDATFCLDVVAAVALAQGHARLAAESSALADAVRERLGGPPWATTRAFAREQAERARAAMGDAAFEAVAREAGERDLFETLDRALETLAAGATVR